jgi:hypothetical protein
MKKTKANFFRAREGSASDHLMQPTPFVIPLTCTEKTKQTQTKTKHNKKIYHQHQQQ